MFSPSYCELLCYIIFFINSVKSILKPAALFPPPHHFNKELDTESCVRAKMYSRASCANIFFCQSKHLLSLHKTTLWNICCNHISHQPSICQDKTSLLGILTLQIAVQHIYITRQLLMRAIFPWQLAALCTLFDHISLCSFYIFSMLIILCLVH